MTVKRMDNVGIVVEDIDAAIEFFTELGLRRRSTIDVSRLRAWCDYVVPFALKSRGMEIEGLEFALGDLDAGRVGALVELGVDCQTSLRGGVGR